MNWELQSKDLSKILLAIIAIVTLVLVLSNVHHLEDAEGIDFGGAPQSWVFQLKS